MEPVLDINIWITLCSVGFIAGMIDAIKMVAFDVCIHLPMIYFPAYYTCKEVVTGTSWNPIDWVKDGGVIRWQRTDYLILICPFN